MSGIKMLGGWTKERLAGLGLIGLVGLIHLVEAPEYYGEVKYVGGLFVASAIAAAVAAIGIARGERWGWTFGLLNAVGCFLGYTASRTVGLPGFREASLAQFLEPMGLLSLIVEALFIVLALKVTSPQTALAPIRASR